MSNIHIAVNGADAVATGLTPLTAGMVGAAVDFTFSGAAWTGLTRVAVFRCGGISRDSARWEGDTCRIPHECLAAAGEPLWVGVYGVNDEGTVVIPTVYADCGVIQPGADPTGDPDADPTEPFFVPLLEKALAEAKAGGQFDGAPGAPGAPGSPGADGKSAYASAQDGGYTGTEAQFNAALAQVSDKQPKITVSGILKGDGAGGVSAAAKGVDYAAPASALSVTLSAAGWDAEAKTQTIAAAGVTAAAHCVVAAAPGSYMAYAEAGVRCAAQGAGTLTFACETVPAEDVAANVLIVG